MRQLMTGYRLTVLGLTLLLALIVALNGFGHFYTDIKPEVYLAPGRMIEQYLSAWTDTPYLGSPNFNVGLVPVLLVTGALRGIGLSPEWTFKVLHFALWLATAWGTARLTRRLVPRAGKYAGLAAGVLILANPYTIQAGSTLAIALPMALLPWSLLVFIRALWTPGRRWFSPRGWMWPAVFGLLFFAMSGMNVAIVPIFQLLALLPVVWVARREWRLRWPVVAAAVGKCALFVVGVSIYWLVPGLGAVSTGTQIVDESESLTGIAKVASYPEVLRGLGLWSLYGQDNHGAWVPQDAVYLTSPIVMVLTMLWPALALLALRSLRGAARTVVAGSIAIAAVLMVGLFPAAGHPSSPFGIVFHWFIDLPGMAAFRTTNKVGAVLALGFAIALGVAAAKVLPRMMRRDGLAPVAAVAVAMLLLSWTLPAFTNRLYTSPMDIPAYWHHAASAIDAGNSKSAVLFLPGQTRPAYRWTVDRPDDVANSLFSRQVILPETSPNASPPGGNFLASLDSTLENGVVPDGTVSTYARYLGADTVLMRHDLNWEDSGGVAPSQVSSIAAADKGMHGVANYGLPGEFVNGSENSGADNQLPPLQQYAVSGAGDSVRVEPTKNSLVVAGDGWSVPAMVGAGLLRGNPSFRYAQDLSAKQLAGSLGSGHTLVLTDTNQRRDAIPNRLSDNQGPLLSAGQSLGVSRALGDDTDDQTVLQRSGARVSATSSGGTFFDLPYAVPENAVDGDPSTAWLFGDFNRAPGNRLTIREPKAQQLGTVRIAQAQVGKVKIDKVTVRAGGKSVTRRMPDTGYASFPLGDTTSRGITVTIDSTRGKGYNLVGLSDIQLPGVPAQRTARAPLTFDSLYKKLSAGQQALFDRTPMDILLTRDQGKSATQDDTETQLRRSLSLPDDRTFDGSAAVRVSGSFESVYDRVAGLSSSVTATSSDFYFRQKSTRASLAADKDSSTAWQPGGTLKGAWWQLEGPKRTINSVSVTQRPADGSGADRRDDYAKRVAITVDGKKVASAQLKKSGTTEIAIPRVDGKAVRGKKVRMTIESTSGPANGVPPRFTSIDTGLRVKHRADLGPIQDADSSDPRCITVATVDGDPLSMRPTTKTLSGSGDQGSKWAMCGSLDLSKGNHRIQPVKGFTLDDLQLTDHADASKSTVTKPHVQVTRDGSTHKTLRVTTTGASAVVLGQSVSDGWHATANGKDLGAPQTIDGYSAGWLLPKSGKYTVDITYSPQLRSNVALAVSIVVILLAVALAVFAFFDRRRKPSLLDPEPEGETDPEDEPTLGDEPGSEQELAAARGPATATRSSGMTDSWERRPRRRRRRRRNSAPRLTTRMAPARVSRVALEVGLVLVAGFFVGWAGLVAGAAVVAVLRWRPWLSPWWFQVTGAALLLIAMGVYLLVLGDTRGTLSADGVARSMWPHWLAGAGLVIGLVGALHETDDHEEDAGDE